MEVREVTWTKRAAGTEARGHPSSLPAVLNLAPSALASRAWALSPSCLPLGAGVMVAAGAQGHHLCQFQALLLLPWVHS